MTASYLIRCGKHFRIVFVGGGERSEAPGIVRVQHLVVGFEQEPRAVVLEGGGDLPAGLRGNESVRRRESGSRRSS